MVRQIIDEPVKSDFTCPLTRLRLRSCIESRRERIFSMRTFQMHARCSVSDGNENCHNPKNPSYDVCYLGIYHETGTASQATPRGHRLVTHAGRVRTGYQTIAKDRIYAAMHPAGIRRMDLPVRGARYFSTNWDICAELTRS